jgi:hypothetical protein
MLNNKIIMIRIIIIIKKVINKIKIKIKTKKENLLLIIIVVLLEFLNKKKFKRGQRKWKIKVKKGIKN